MILFNGSDYKLYSTTVDGDYQTRLNGSVQGDYTVSLKVIIRCGSRRLYGIVQRDYTVLPKAIIRYCPRRLVYCTYSGVHHL